MIEITKLKHAARVHPLWELDKKIALGKGNLDSPDILFLGEAPGKEENKTGIPFVGRSGKLLDNLIPKLNIKNYAVVNAVPLMPIDSKSKIRKPTEEEIAYFRPYIKNIIKAINPKKIVCLGKTAAECLEINFKLAEWQDNVGCLYHPAYYLRQGQDGLIDGTKLFQQKTKLKTEFIINKQKADNQGHKEMINGILAGLHLFAKEAGVFFKDINQKDECMLGNKKVKVYTRDIMSDEDMLVYESYYKAHPEIDLYVCCKMKAGEYWYVGYTTKEVVDNTRVVQMIGQESDKESSEVRCIFAEQYKPISDLIKIHEEETEEEKIILQSYVPLHVHSEFSIGDGYGTIKYLAETLYKKGFKGAALTDHGTLAGVWEFQKAMLEHNLKPILGCEFYVRIPDLDRRLHINLIAKNKEGWQNLLKLQSLAVREGFYYKPIIEFKHVLAHSKGLIATASCLDGIIHALIKEDKEDMAETYANILQSHFGENFYGEIQLHTSVSGHQEVMKKAIALYDKLKIKSIITTDSHYPKREDKKYHEAIKAIGMKKKYGEAGFGDDVFFLMTDDDFKRRTKAIKENNWIIPRLEELKANTLDILEKANFLIEPPKEIDTLPKLYSGQQERKEKLKQLCIDGLAKFTPYKYEGKTKERLDLEMNRILEKDYENYFLMVYELIKWAKEQGIMCGPGRGSVGASLAAYALNITECDPMKFDLLFDRFMSEIRRDMPDADMDFQDTRRQEVFGYLRDTYGENHCAKVATYSRFHPKGILRDIGRIYSIPIGEIERICSMVIQRSGGDARASFGLLDTFAEFETAKEFKAKYPEAAEIAIKLEGHIRHKGIHAAAMVVSENDISSYIPINKCSGEIITEWEKQLVEDMHLIKFDILGLKTLSVINDCVQDTRAELPKDFGDPEVYDSVFKDGRTLGVFQFETVGLSKLIKNLKANNFSTLYDATTLFRPGALHSGQTMLYQNRHLGKDEVKYEHPLLEEISKTTLGIILYQEQIMQIMNQIGGMSWATAEMARKTITKSKGKKAFEEMRAEFVRNANRLHKTPTEEAEKLYDVVSTFGSYGFNKAHAVAYSIISYWCAWFKTYYPLEFYKAILKYETDDTQIANYLQDAGRSKIVIEYPHINNSEFSYSIRGDKIYSGFNSIKGIGERTANKIVKNQPYKDFADFVKRSKVSGKILKGLVISDCFRDFAINKKELYTQELGVADFSEAEYAQIIMKETTLKPKLDVRKAFDFDDLPYDSICDLSEELHGNKIGYIRGIVTDTTNKDKLIRSDIKAHNHNFESHMIYLTVNDGTGNLAVQVNPWTYTKYKHIIHNLESQPVIVFGLYAKSGQKMYAELIDTVGKTNKVSSLYKNLKSGKTLIISAIPAVSKKGNSYYRLQLSDGAKGLCFKPPSPLWAGLEVGYRMEEEPFMEIRLK